MENLIFITQTKQWINHKLILANSSNWYKIPYRKMAVVKVKDNFSDFLLNTTKYSVLQIALMIKRNESILETLLPIPSNPSYLTAIATFKCLVVEAEKIINQFNLTA
jgi:hypothetical protein